MPVLVHLITVNYRTDMETLTLRYAKDNSK